MGKGISISFGNGSGFGAAKTTVSKGQTRKAFLTTLPFIIAFLYVIVKVIFFSPLVELSEFLIVLLIAGIIWYPFIIFMWFTSSKRRKNG